MSKIEKKNISVTSHVDISYNSLPANSLTKDLSSDNSVTDTYEEVNDYSFLNVITEEVTTVDSLQDINSIKTILSNSFLDTENNKSLDSNLYDNQINDLIKNLDNNQYKAVMHSIDNNSYLELVGQNNDSYTVQLHGNSFFAEDNISIDNILTCLIENHSHKFS